MGGRFVFSIRAIAIVAAIVVGALGASIAAETPTEQKQSFEQWRDELRRDALGSGIRAETFDRAFAGVVPIERVIELDRKQPEFTQTFWGYLNARVNPNRIERGRELLEKHRPLLERVRQEYGVQPRFIVAFWGLESNYGDYTGDFPTVGALATLAYDDRRGAFFRAQLLALLKLIERGDIPNDVDASWAGAMGQTQFIPTTYLDFAVDFDGDGKRDLWNSLPDIFASSANYLKNAGWQGDRTWGREVRLPKDFDLSLTGLETEKPLAAWQELGVRKVHGGDLPQVDIDGSIILPGGIAGGPPFMVYQNFHSILVWNRSILYAVAVGHLADRLEGKGPLVTPVTNDVPLSRQDVMEIQTLLGELGFEAGTADGIVGPNTRKAIRGFQSSARLPADGYPSIGILERLRLATRN